MGWVFRSAHFEGDGRLIVRITEDHLWLVNNELLGQALIQLVYQSLSFMSLTAFEVLQVLSCLHGVVSLFLLGEGSKQMAFWNWVFIFIWAL